MDDSQTPPDSATTARDSIRRTFDNAKDENPERLGQSSTLQDKLERDNQKNDRFDDGDHDEPSVPLERSPTYVREFWKFHMRAADDDEEQ